MPKDVCGFEPNFLKQIKSLMEETSIEELEIKEGENKYLKISKKKYAQESAPVYAVPPAYYSSAPAPSAHAPAAAENSKVVAAAPKVSAYDDETKFSKIKSPVIGTFYSSPSPDSPPFVKTGDSVSPDTTVCIVEAMKVMNEIKADVQGKIVQILKSNSNPVQANEVLFIVEK